MHTETLVLALGNPLRADDGVGADVLDRLASAELPQPTTLLDGGTAGLETAILLEGYQRVFIIDAADMQIEAGTWRRFQHTAVQPNAEALQSGTLHYAGLHEALLLAEALAILPDDLIIYGIQPASLDWKIGISSIVQNAVQAVTAAILHEINHPKGDNDVYR